MTSSASKDDQPRPAPHSPHFASHGRGGAGNMASADRAPRPTPSDLETPVLKTAIVTTGRGGTGNMAKNDDPVETRMRQDVEGEPPRLSSGVQHAGRGGAGNIVHEGGDGAVEFAPSEYPDADDSLTPREGRKWLRGKKE